MTTIFDAFTGANDDDKESPETMQTRIPLTDKPKNS